MNHRYTSLALALLDLGIALYLLFLILPKGAL